MNLRQELQKLTGKTVATLDQNKRFDVIAVKPNQILLYIQSTDKERKIQWEEIEPAWEMLQQQGQLTRVAIRDNFSERNPAYVAALLAALPGVTHRLVAHPPHHRAIITLYYGRYPPRAITSPGKTAR